MLLVRKKFFEDIRRGAKTTTLRFWRWCRTPAGSVHSVRGLGRLRIDSARAVEWGQLTDADARADGFGDLAALRAALESLYPPEKRQGRKLYQVRFTYLGDPAAGP
jgi:hypothetical protein